jgi:hypothetical protein
MIDVGAWRQSSAKKESKKGHMHRIFT